MSRHVQHPRSFGDGLLFTSVQKNPFWSSLLQSRYCWCWSSSNCSCPQHTKHKTQNTKHKTQNTKLKTQATSNQHELPLPILSNGFALYSHGNICHGPNSGLIVFPRVHARLTSAGFAALHSVPLFRAPMHTPSINRAMGVGLALCGCRSIKKPNTQLIVGGSGRI